MLLRPRWPVAALTAVAVAVACGGADPPYEGGAEVSPDGDLVVFTSRRNGDDRLYVARRDGGDVRRLTGADDIAGEYGATWSPDGRRIAFAAARAGEVESMLLRVADVATGRVRTLTRREAYHPAWSPDGRTIAFTRDAGIARPRIWLIRPDGSGERRLIDDGGSPARSPDSSAIASVPGFEIYDLGRERIVRRLAVPRVFSGPAWSSDGLRIAIAGTPPHERGSDEEIYVIDVRSRALQRLTHNGLDDLNPSWAPGGEIVFDTADELRIASSDGSNVRPLFDY